jgi:hypothetical protein
VRNYEKQVHPMILKQAASAGPCFVLRRADSLTPSSACCSSQISMHSLCACINSRQRCVCQQRSLPYGKRSKHNALVHHSQVEALAGV